MDILKSSSAKLIGQTFGRLTVEGVTRKGKKNEIHCVCRCSCGNTNKAVVVAHRLKRKETQSCGCLTREAVIKRNTKHGRYDDPLYGIWCNIKARCFDARSTYFHHYGGRGITLYEPWINNFEAFYAWIATNLGPRPSKCTLDRISNELGYIPGNLRWATRYEQVMNRRTTRYVTAWGITKPLAEWAEEFGLEYSTLRRRLDICKCSAETALSNPLRNRLK